MVGITNRGPLLDGGKVNVPEFGFAAVDGQWIIEGHGVDPDIEVENDPKSVIEGRDPQLERGRRGGDEEGSRTTKTAARSTRPAGEDSLIASQAESDRCVKR